MKHSSRARASEQMRDENGTDRIVEIPLFPLRTVLFPGGAMPLRIFEPRYLEMISECLKTGGRFGISLIREGSETGRAATFQEIGTLGSISYWQQLPNGMLGITVRGEQRFRILSSRTLPNQLIRAQVELLPTERRLPVPEHCHHARELLGHLLEQLGLPYNKPPFHFEDAGWVGCRLAELLPLSLGQKQQLLQLNDPLERLERLHALLKKMGIRRTGAE